jgi:hypothetical protein
MANRLLIATHEVIFQLLANADHLFLVCKQYSTQGLSKYLYVWLLESLHFNLNFLKLTKMACIYLPS